MERTDDIAYEWWFAGIRSLSDRKKKYVREIYGSGKEIYKQLYNIEEKHFHRLGILKDQEIRALREAARTQDVFRLYEKGVQRGIRLIPCWGGEYPARLARYSGMPYALYALGGLPAADRPTAAVVGARQCTVYGEKMAAAFAKSLASCGVQVISGMAWGVDGAAQRAAIQEGGSSFGILGGGVDVCYPRENRGLYADLQVHGGLLSEQPPGTPPRREYFPARNRIISGLADVILVIEARKRSGSLITADIALEQGKDIYALPGPVTSELSRGCHELIRQGAGILLSPEDLLEELGLEPIIFTDEKDGRWNKNKKMLERKEKLVYASIDLFPRSLNELIGRTQLPAEELMRILVSLEIQGYIRELSKNYFIRV